MDAPLCPDCKQRMKLSLAFSEPVEKVPAGRLMLVLARCRGCSQVGILDGFQKMEFDEFPQPFLDGRSM